MVIHMDVWGLVNTASLSGARWFISFIDDHTCMTWICLMKSNDEVSSLFQQFHRMISTNINLIFRFFIMTMVENLLIMIGDNI